MHVCDHWRYDELTCDDCYASQFSDHFNETVFMRLNRRPLTRFETLVFDICTLARQDPEWIATPKQLDRMRLLSRVVAKQADISGFGDGWPELREGAQSVLMWLCSLEYVFFKDNDVMFSIGCHEDIATGRMYVGTDIMEQAFRYGLLFQSTELCRLFGDDLDYEPGTNNQVLTLVDPALFALEYGTNILKHTLEPIPMPETDRPWWPRSDYQCLATLFKCDLNGVYTAKSYINNLHPVKFKSLYDSIEQVLNDCVPALEYVLSRCVADPLGLEKQPYENYLVDIDEEQEADLILTAVAAWVDGKQKLAKQYLHDKFKRHIHLGPMHVDFPFMTSIRMTTNFKLLLIFVKMTNIELTPEKPRYEDRIWNKDKVMDNIVAVIVYFYDVDNVKLSEIVFAEPCRDYIECPLDKQDAFVDKVYGMKLGDPMVRNAGSCKVEYGRAVVFSSKLCYKIQKCELDDPTENGSIKMVTMFILDPNGYGANTTLCIVPRQKEWYEDPSLKHLFPDNLGDNYKTQTMDEAKEMRQKIVDYSLENRRGQALDGLALTLGEGRFFKGGRNDDGNGGSDNDNDNDDYQNGDYQNGDYQNDNDNEDNDDGERVILDMKFEIHYVSNMQ